MNFDLSDIRRIAKDLIELSRDYKVVQTTKTTIRHDNGLSYDPTGTQTTVEYSIEKK